MKRSWSWPMGLILAALAFLSFCPGKAHPQTVVNFGYFPVGQMRFLYAHMRTEFAGCLYGTRTDDTVNVQVFMSSSTDPRTASDSAVAQGRCFRSFGRMMLVGIVHSHIRGGFWNCVPSGFSVGDESPPRKDRSVYLDWLNEGILFGAIMCARGDSIVVYGEYEHTVFAIPILDSLYAEVGTQRP